MEDGDDWKPGESCDTSKVFLDLLAHLAVHHQQQQQCQYIISISTISASATVAQHNSHQHSPSFQWIQIVSQRIEVVSQSWLDDRTPLVHIDRDRDRCVISYISFHIFILPTCCQTFFSRMFSSDKPQGPSRFQSPGIQGKRVPRPGSRMARGPDQVKIKVKENSSHLDEVEVLLEKDKRLPFLQGKLGQH